MARFTMIVLTSPVKGREAEFEQWYGSIHLPEVLSVSGIVAGRRLEAAPQSPMPPPGRHLAIVEMDLDDPNTALAELNRRRDAGEVHMSAAIDETKTQVWLFQPL